MEKGERIAMEKILTRIREKKFVLIAEIGVNYYDIAQKLHITPMQAAKMMILEAKNAGVHAVKFQSYKADTLAAKDSPSYWDTSEETETSQYLLFKKFDSFGKKEYFELSEFCKQVEIDFLSTAFDIESVDYLTDIMDVFKISSSDLNNLPFVKYQAKKNKPIILSVGASELDEIKETVKLIRKYNDKEIILMHCILEYPAPYEHANLSKILSLQQEFPKFYIGYSDHTKPNDNYDVIKTAYLLGAKVIEKHFTLDKALKGNDHYHAMDAFDAKRIIQAVRDIDILLGDGTIQCLESEREARNNARRSLVANVDIEKGTIITEDMLTYKRPGTGISVSVIDDVIAKKAKCDIKKDTILKREMIK